jgi:hypothetical protein
VVGHPLGSRKGIEQRPDILDAIAAPDGFNGITP